MAERGGAFKPNNTSSVSVSGVLTVDKAVDKCYELLKSSGSVQDLDNLFKQNSRLAGALNIPGRKYEAPVYYLLEHFNITPNLIHDEVSKKYVDSTTLADHVIGKLNVLIKNGISINATYFATTRQSPLECLCSKSIERLFSGKTNMVPFLTDDPSIMDYRVGMNKDKPKEWRPTSEWELHFILLGKVLNIMEALIINGATIRPALFDVIIKANAGKHKEIDYLCIYLKGKLWQFITENNFRKKGKELLGVTGLPLPLLNIISEYVVAPKGNTVQQGGYFEKYKKYKRKYLNKVKNIDK